MILVLFSIAFALALLAIALFCALKAPLGYQDESGFHFGTPEQPLNASPSTKPRDDDFPSILSLRWPEWVSFAAVAGAMMFAVFLRISEGKKPVHVVERNPAVMRASDETAAPVAAYGPSAQILPDTLCQRFTEVQ